MTAKIFLVDAEKAKTEAQKRYKLELDREKSYFGGLVFKSKAWYKLKSAMRNANESQIIYIQDGLKITIERL